MPNVDIIQLLKQDGGEKFYPVTHVDAVIGLKDASYFDLVPDTQDPTKFSVKLKSEYTGLWAEGWVSAGGVGSGSGGGGGSNTLSGLIDVYGDSGHVLHSDGTQAVGGDALTYNSSIGKWVASPFSGGNCGTALSITNTTTYLVDANGNFIIDRNGYFLATSDVGVNVNLLDGSGTIISTVSIPSTSATALLSSYVPTSRRINGHALASDITLSAVDDFGVSEWAIGGSGSTIPYNLLPELYTAGTRVTGIATKGTLLGVNAISNDLSSTGSENSLIKWENGAWHVFGNLYADGWIAAGGIGNDSGGGSVSFLKELVDVYHDEYGVLRANGSDAVVGDALVYSGPTLGWVAAAQSGGITSLYALDEVLSTTNPSTNQIFYFNGSKWTSIALKTINYDSLLGSGNINIQGGGGGGISSVTLASGTNNGTLKLTVDGTTTDNIAVTGLGSLAYKSSLSASDIPTLAYLPLSGGELTGDLRLRTGGGTSGSTLRFGDGNYAYIQEPLNDDDHLTMYAANGITLSTGSDYGIETSNYIDIGNVRLVYDSDANALHVTKKDGASGNIGLYADGFVAAGGVAGGTPSYVDLDSNQTIGGNKTFTGTTSFNSDRYTLSINNDEINFESRLYIQYNSNDLCLTRNGKTIIGGYPGSSAIGDNKLYVAGTAIATTWNTTSDFRLKDDISVLKKDEAIEKLMALKPSMWKWNSGLAKGMTASGFIAQEVESVLPFMVTGEDYKGLAYQMLHAYEVSAIQSHEERIRVLEKKVKTMEG